MSAPARISAKRREDRVARRVEGQIVTCVSRVESGKYLIHLAAHRVRDRNPVGVAAASNQLGEHGVVLSSVTECGMNPGQ